MNSHLKDTFKHKGKRKILIAELVEMGIKDQAILDAFNEVPRHFFLDLAFDEQAYTNMAFQIGSGQTISHPFTVAFQTQLLDLKKAEKVLEIGTGSGFQTCILCKLGVRVYTIERHHDLHDKARRMLTFLNLNARMNFGDGYKGMPSHAPFDKILVTAGAEEIPKKLLIQLKVGGIMVIPVGKNVQEMIVVKRISKLKFEKENHGSFKFVPLLKDLN